jgi:hypothetical protein
MAKRFGERLRELQEHGEEVLPGGTLSVWMPDEMVASLTALASEVGISRSALLRELVEIALPEAWEELRPDLKQLPLAISEPKKPAKKNPRKMPVRVGRLAKGRK